MWAIDKDDMCCLISLTLSHPKTFFKILGALQVWAIDKDDMCCVLVDNLEGKHSQKSARCSIYYVRVQHASTHCNTLKHTATHCNTLQHTEHTATRCCVPIDNLVCKHSQKSARYCIYYVKCQQSQLMRISDQVDARCVFALRRLYCDYVVSIQ